MSNHNLSPQSDRLVGMNSDSGTNHGVGTFPKEYRRSLRDYFDLRFLVIWSATFVVHFCTAIYFAIHPPDTSIKRNEIDRLQQQFATLVLEKTAIVTPLENEIPPIKATPSETDSYGTGGQGRGTSRRSGGMKSEGTGDARHTTLESRQAAYDGLAEERAASREQISREVSSKGLLGLLTGSGSEAKGEAITDVLGKAAGSHKDLDKVLGGLDGLKRNGPPSTGKGSAVVAPGVSSGPGSPTQKGTRATTGGGIDELLEGKKLVKEADFQRKGNIVVEEVSAIADEKGIKSESRDSDKVSEVINNHNSSIQYCYQRELKLNPDLKGKLVVRFIVTPEGKVRDVKIISSTLNNPNMERCIVSRIRRWDDFGQIDPSKGDATFRQVYTFGY